MYGSLCSRLLFPLHERFKGHTTLAIRERLEESQWWPAERIMQWQNQRLSQFLRSVSLHVPYYRNLFQSMGLAASDFLEPSLLKAITPSTKRTMRENADLLKSESAKELRRFSTGGSTGEPLIFYIGSERVSHDVAAKWRATRWWDVDIGDREVVVWGSPIELKAQDRLRSFRDRVLRSHLLPAFDMSAAQLDSYLTAICALRPRMLFGYPSSLAAIAAHAAKIGKRMDNLGVKVAFVTSERLYEDQRNLITSVFGCPVANGYGGRDAGFIAHECPAGKMHISAEDIIVELLDESGKSVSPGMPGEIVLTHLCTADYPFVRYRTGDVAVLDDSACDCGRGLPVLKEIRGRTTDFVLTQDGAILHGLALIYPVREVDGIEQFQIIQHDLLRTEVLIVPGRGYDASGEQKIRRECQSRLGSEVTVSVRQVDVIPREANGKYRYVVSKLAGARGAMGASRSTQTHEDSLSSEHVEAREQKAVRTERHA